jgi:hypothetical protein
MDVLLRSMARLFTYNIQYVEDRRIRLLQLLNMKLRRGASQWTGLPTQKEAHQMSILMDVIGNTVT